MKFKIFYNPAFRAYWPRRGFLTKTSVSHETNDDFSSCLSIPGNSRMYGSNNKIHLQVSCLTGNFLRHQTTNQVCNF